MTRMQLTAACALDAVLGDPPNWPHPVRVFGRLIEIVDRRRDRAVEPARQMLEGAVLTLTLVAAAAVAGVVVERRFALPAVVLAAATLAARSLDDAVAAVQNELVRGDLAAARTNLAQIVGRDVAELDEAGIAAAALECLGESFCDGVVAPLFWLRTGGLGAALAFKAISTLDSMIGHIEAPYTWFGRFAARADDTANFLPARIAAAAIVLAALARANGVAAAGASLATAWRDAPAHRSPNGGWPEAALAGALGVQLGGQVSYDGVVTPRAAIGAGSRAPAAADIAAGRQLIARAALLVTGCAVMSAP
jgi:adenosylcobinamide-phosphate synthase